MRERRKLEDEAEAALQRDRELRRYPLNEPQYLPGFGLDNEVDPLRPGR